MAAASGENQSVVQCLNCGSSASGAVCSECGARLLPSAGAWIAALPAILTAVSLGMIGHTISLVGGPLIPQRVGGEFWNLTLRTALLTTVPIMGALLGFLGGAMAISTLRGVNTLRALAIGLFGSLLFVGSLAAAGAVASLPLEPVTAVGYSLALMAGMLAGERVVRTRILNILRRPEVRFPGDKVLIAFTTTLAMMAVFMVVYTLFIGALIIAIGYAITAVILKMLWGIELPFVFRKKNKDEPETEEPKGLINQYEANVNAEYDQAIATLETHIAMTQGMFPAAERSEIETGLRLGKPWIAHYDGEGRCVGTTKLGSEGWFEHFDDEGRGLGSSVVNRSGGLDHHHRDKGAFESAFMMAQAHSRPDNDVFHVKGTVEHDEDAGGGHSVAKKEVLAQHVSAKRERR